jgi:hypothetical protein
VGLNVQGLSQLGASAQSVPSGMAQAATQREDETKAATPLVMNKTPKRTPRTRGQRGSQGGLLATPTKAGDDSQAQAGEAPAARETAETATGGFVLGVATPTTAEKATLVSRRNSIRSRPATPLAKSKTPKGTQMPFIPLNQVFSPLNQQQSQEGTSEHNKRAESGSNKEVEENAPMPDAEDLLSPRKRARPEKVKATEHDGDTKMAGSVPRKFKSVTKKRKEEETNTAAQGDSDDFEPPENQPTFEKT